MDAAMLQTIHILYFSVSKKYETYCLDWMMNSFTLFTFRFFVSAPINFVMRCRIARQPYRTIRRLYFHDIICSMIRK